MASGTFYPRSLGDGGSLRSSRCRRSRVRAAHATCAACMRALPARLCRRDKVCWWQAVRCSAAAARGQRCLEAARSRRVSHCTLEPPWLRSAQDRARVPTDSADSLLGAPALTDPYLQFLCDKEFDIRERQNQTSTNRVRSHYGPSPLRKPGLAGLAG